MKRNVVEEVIWHEKLLDYNFYLIKLKKNVINEIKKEIEEYLLTEKILKEKAKEDIKKLLDSFFK